MSELLLRHPALRRLPMWCLIAFLTAQAVYGLSVLAVSLTALTWKLALLGCSWLVITEYLQLGQVRQRASRFDLALPLPVRRLWAASLLGSYLSALGVLAMLCLVLLVGLGFFVLVGGGIGYVFRDVATAFVLIAAALLPATVWAHGRRPDLATAPRGWRHFLHVWALNLPLGGLMLLMRDAPSMFLPVALVAGAGLLLRQWRRIPGALSVAPREASAPGRARGSDGGRGAVRSRPLRGLRGVWAVYEVAYRTAPKGVALFFVAGPLLTLFGWVLSGAASAFGSDFEMRFLLVSMMIYMVVTTVAPLMQNLKPFDTLPLSRRSLFALFCLPVLLCMGLGYGTGSWWLRGHPAADTGMTYVEDHQYWGLRVPRALWRLSLDGDPPVQVSPDGESHAPLSLQVLPGLPLRLWKPYTTPRSASQGYVEWQTARALGDRYGESLGRADVADRYFLADAEGIVHLRRTDSVVLEAPAGLTPVPGPRHAPALFLVVLASSLLILAWFAPRIRASISKTRRTAYLWIPLGSLLGLHLAQFLLPPLIGSQLWVMNTSLRIAYEAWLAAVPGGYWGAWLFCVLGVWAAFEVAVRAFGKTESPIDNTSCMWNAIAQAD